MVRIFQVKAGEFMFIPVISGYVWLGQVRSGYVR